jgi:hypothetical protein
MIEITAPDTAASFRCEFCQKDFRRESTLLAHLCESKRRHREQNETGVQLGLQAYLRFYETTQGSAKLKTWQDFSTSAYYRAFVKFGRYCQDIRAVNTRCFIDWLIRNNVKLDCWCKDRYYLEYLLEHVRRENVNDALSRAIECAIEWQERTGNSSTDYLRYGNDNAICHDIMRGRVTAWAIYSCDSGVEFLDRINQEQVAMIWDWIDSDAWQRRFRDFPADQEYAREMLTRMGW